jgi:hypothetical protein
MGRKETLSHTAVSEEQLARRELRKNKTGNACRAWWAAVETVLRLYERNAVDGFKSNTPLPAELISDLKSLAGFLAVGKIPRLIELVRKEGRTKPTPPERLDMIIAILYVAAAKDGIRRNGRTMKIIDPSPIKTVANAYRVEKRTVQKWYREYSVDIASAIPLDSTNLKKLLLIAGEQYQKIGRSQEAIRLRANKRREPN